MKVGGFSNGERPNDARITRNAPIGFFAFFVGFTAFWVKKMPEIVAFNGCFVAADFRPKLLVFHFQPIGMELLFNGFVLIQFLGQCSDFGSQFGNRLIRQFQQLFQFAFFTV